MAYKKWHGTQTALARHLGVSCQFVTKWKQGKSGLRVATAQRWSKLLGIKFEKLMTAKARDRPKILGLKK